MIEETLKSYLSDATKQKVWLEIPPKPPSEFIIIEKTAGGESNHIQSATFAIQSWAASMHDAAELNETVKKAMNNITDLPEIAGAHLQTDYNFTDTTTKKYRYQAVYDLNFY